MDFKIIPPSKPPRPIAAYKFVNRSIWKVQVLAHQAASIEGVPRVYLNFLLRLLISALRDAADNIEQTIEARRNGGRS